MYITKVLFSTCWCVLIFSSDCCQSSLFELLCVRDGCLGDRPRQSGLHQCLPAARSPPHDLAHQPLPVTVPQNPPLRSPLCPWCCELHRVSSSPPSKSDTYTGMLVKCINMTVRHIHMCQFDCLTHTQACQTRQSDCQTHTQACWSNASI